jgi:hypothetical protein
VNHQRSAVYIDGMGCPPHGEVNQTIKALGGVDARADRQFNILSTTTRRRSSPQRSRKLVEIGYVAALPGALTHRAGRTARLP